ncbi:MAG: bacteriophage Gp15 family protein [Clostridia bacterium]
MNDSDVALLTDDLPNTVEIAGKEVPIHTDFRNGIQFERLVLDGSIEDAVKVNTALMLFFGDYARIRNREAAIEAALWFYSCGRYPTSDTKGQKPSKRYYDYAADARLIYAAFLDQYHIDLQTSELHWWQFCAMLAGLKADAEFSKIIGYRAIDVSKVKNQEERARYRRLQALYALPDNRTHEEKVASAGAAFGRSAGI